MDNTEIMTATIDTIGELNSLIDKAGQDQVEEIYTQQADQLKQQMTQNLEARNIYSMLEAYPQREYPEPEPLDKNGKPLKKDKNEKPKKKKKEPPFPTPDWAVELDQVTQKVKLLETLAQNAAHLKLEREFLDKVDIELKRFKKEIAFRRAQEEEARLEAEAKALAKKKAAKKK